MATQKQYKKAYEILCKKANGALVIEPYDYTKKLIVLENKWHDTVPIMVIQDEKIFDVAVVYRDDFKTLPNYACIVKILLQYASSFDVVVGLFKPEMLLSKGETLEKLLIEHDLEAIA